MDKGKLVAALTEHADAYTQALNTLEGLGILAYMKTRYSPRPSDTNSINYTQQVLVENGRAQGYREAYEDLTNMLLSAANHKPVAQANDTLGATYGALEDLLSKGRITKEEYEYRKRSRSKSIQ